MYFGGGTPSLLDGATIGAILDAARERWPTALDEVTIEANPSSRETPDWAGYRAAGVTRISLGVQSLRDQELVSLARGHSAAEARDAFAAARSARFEDVSIDLIYGIGGQTLDDWRDGLERAIDLGPDHVSCYALQLALQPDEWAARPRPGALRWRDRMVRRQDDELAGDQYMLAAEVLGSAGYVHYELSSWARPGHESRHNAAYWARRPYTGIGAGAHSYDGAAERSWNVRELDAYLAGLEVGERPVAGREALDAATRAFEAVALGLRRIDGIRRSEVIAEFGEDPMERHGAAVDEVVRAGLLEVDGDRVRLTDRGRLLASEVLLAFMPEATARR